MSSAVSTTSLVVPAMGDTMAAGLWPGGKKVANEKLLKITLEKKRLSLVTKETYKKQQYYDYDIS